MVNVVRTWGPALATLQATLQATATRTHQSSHHVHVRLPEQRTAWQLLCVHSPKVDAVLAAPLGDHVAALTRWLCSGLQALTTRLGAVGVLAQACCQLNQGGAHSLCAGLEGGRV